MIRTHLDLQESEVLAELANGSGFDVHCDQIEAGELAGTVDFVATPDVQFFRDRFGRAVLIHGAVPQGMPSFTFPESDQEAAVFCGQKTTAQTLGVIEAGTGYSYGSAGGQGIFGCCVTEERLERALNVQHQTTLQQVMPRTGNLEVAAVCMAAMRHVMNAAFVSPPPESHDLILDPDAPARCLEDALLAAIGVALTSRMPSSPRPLAGRNHWRCVRLVSEYIGDHLGQPLRMEALCLVAGVSERTLETSFLEVTGVNPRRFIKIRRLNAVRHILHLADPGEASVKAVALQAGFWHLGHFASDYKKHFAECPSRTLANRHLT